MGALINILLLLCNYITMCIGENRACEWVETRNDTVHNYWNQTHYFCPGTSFSEEYTECCGLGLGGCCQEPSFLQISSRVTIAVSVSVTLACVALSVVFILCCFWSRCPCYRCGAVKFYQTDIIATVTAEDMERMDGMPDYVQAKGQKSYDLNTVSVKPLQEDV